MRLWRLYVADVVAIQTMRNGHMMWSPMWSACWCGGGTLEVLVVI